MCVRVWWLVWCFAHVSDGVTWRAPSLASQPKSLRDIRKDMHRQREWRNELDKMKISNVVSPQP